MLLLLLSLAFLSAAKGGVRLDVLPPPPPPLDSQLAEAISDEDDGVPAVSFLADDLSDDADSDNDDEEDEDVDDDLEVGGSGSAPI